MKKIDVLINVFGKPYQTALSLLSLLYHSGHHIDTIYFHEEPARLEMERRDHLPLLRYLKHRVVCYTPRFWLSSDTTDEQRLLTDSDYRLSMRYQYGWEQTDKQHALLIHNDIYVTGDIVAALMDSIQDATAIGELGQCWWCPAGQMQLCLDHHYENFRPKYHQLMYLYNDGMDYTQRRAYNLGLREEFRINPWPLPECRVNEWCMLVNMDKARPATQPVGTAAPVGCVFASGAQIGVNWDEPVNLDTGVQWFRDLNHMGHRFVHYPIDRYIVHDRRGNVALSQPELYIRNEMLAKSTLRAEYPDFFAML